MLALRRGGRKSRSRGSRHAGLPLTSLSGIIRIAWLQRARAALAVGSGLALLNFSLLAHAGTDDSPEPGHERSLVPIPLDPDEGTAIPAPNIDGRLDDPVWQRAEVSGGFWNSIQDRLPSDQTEVQTAMDNEYLYFGVRMFDTEPSAIESTRSVRDGNLGYDDSITIELDTFFNRRDISRFSLNPRGTQTDAIAGGRSSKIEWKGDWLGAATLTDYGWSAEFAIPFAMLNFDNDATRFGVNFKRYQSRTREYSYWANVTPQELEEEMGQLDGLTLPASSGGKTWIFMPFALAGRNIPDANGDIDRSLVTAGVDIRYEPRPDLTAVFAANPDFSQVEEAVTDISFSYSEKSLDENRAFFAEGADYFSPEDDDNEYFYSNRVPDFDVGAKSFGRAGQARYGLLATRAPGNRLDIAARTLYEVDERNSAIATIVSSDRSDFDNLLTVAQFRGRQPSGLNYSIDAAFTETSGAIGAEIPEGHGSHYKASIGWRSDYFYTRVDADKYETSYFPANALLDADLPGTKSSGMVAGYYRDISHSAVRIVESYIGHTQRNTLLGQKQRERTYIGTSVEFNNDIRATVYVEDGPYRPVTDTRGVFEAELNDDHYSSVAVDFNTRSNTYSGGVQYDSGKLGGGSYEYFSGYGWWRPTNAVYFKLSAERIHSFGTYNQIVLASTWDIDAEHALSGRIIKTDRDKYVRLAYSHRPREGLDIFAVYDRGSSGRSELSVKLVKTF
jgi:hypothetical protein